MLFFRLDGRLVSISEDEIGLVNVFEEPELEKLVGKIRELIEIVEK